MAESRISGRMLGDAIETIELDTDGPLGSLVQMVAERDAPFLACAPS